MSKGNDILAIHHEGFLHEGAMVAMPLGFPGATIPIDPNDSYVTALTIDRRDRYETFYGGTAGRKARLFFGWLRGVTGIIVDLGGDGESTETAGVAATRRGIVAALNGPGGARLLTRHRQPMSWDCTQEWFIDMKPFRRGPEMPNRRVSCLLPGPHDEGVVGLADGGGAFAWDGRAKRVSWMAAPPLLSLTRTASGRLLGVDAAGTVSLLRHARRGLHARRLARLDGVFHRVTWSAPGLDDTAWLADAAGKLFRIETGRVRDAGRAPLAPVTCLAALPDGRLFGACGDGIGQLFAWEPPRGPARLLGVGLSVLNQRRYGYQYSCAAVNRDGHVLFGERDRGGHVWLYCPALGSRRNTWR